MPTFLEQVQQLIQECQNEIVNARIANTKPDLVKIDNNLFDALDIIKNVLLPNDPQANMTSSFLKEARKVIARNKRPHVPR